MESEAFRAEIKLMATVHRFIWMAFVGAVPVYVIVAYFQSDQGGSGRGQALPGPIAISMVVIGVLAAVLAPFMPRILLPDWRLRQLLDRQSDLQATDRFSADERRMLALFPNFFVGFMVQLAFNESIALYGLVWAALTKSFIPILPFAIVSFVLLLMVPLPLDSMRQRTARLGLQEGGMPTQPQ